MAHAVLIVDDSKLAHAVIQQSLEMAGIACDSFHTAFNGQEGLAVLETHSIDLVICDIHMPVMDGIAMITAMRREERWKSIPVVVISSEGGQERVNRMRELGIRSFIRKPFTPELVREAVDLALGEDRA